MNRKIVDLEQRIREQAELMQRRDREHQQRYISISVRYLQKAILIIIEDKIEDNSTSLNKPLS